MFGKLKPKSEFGKNILGLVNTTIIATFISLISLPIITRLYDPAVFGEFQVLLSTIGILSVVSSFKYEMAIVLPKNKIEANSVYSISIILLLLTTLIFSFIFYFFGTYLLELINLQKLEPYLFMLVIGIFLSGAVQIGRYVLIKEKKFHELGKNRVIESGVSQGLKISMGFIHPTFLGLFISQLVAFILNLYLVMKKSTISFTFTKKRLWLVFRKYKNFLYFNTPAMFVNTLAMHLPIFFIAKYFTTEYVGYYMLALRLIEVPLKMLSGPISEVYYKEAIDTYHKGTKQLFNLYKSTVKKLIIFMILPSFLIFFLSEPLIPYILGESWTITGKVMSILIIWKFFEFINSPISTTLIVINQQHIDFLLKLFLSLGLRVLLIVFFTDDFFEMMWALIISASFYYIVFNLIIYILLRKKNEN